MKPFLRHAVAPLALALALTQLQGCFPLMAGSVAGAVLVGLDRRHAGTQAMDRGLQLEIDAGIAARFGNQVHVNASVFNRKVLLTGEARTIETRAAVEDYVRGRENVRAVVNEITLGPPSTLTARAEDALLTTRVKSSLVAAENVPSASMRVVTEGGSVYLMGVLTEAEADRAARIASQIAGVRRVVKVFDVLTEEERAVLDRGAAKVVSGAGQAPRPAPAADVGGNIPRTTGTPVETPGPNSIEVNPVTLPPSVVPSGTLR